MAKTTADAEKAPEDTQNAQPKDAKVGDKAQNSVKSSGAGDASPSSSEPAPASAPEQSETSLTHDSQPRELSLRAFLRVCGQRPDQIAGFARFAELNKPGRFTLQDWKDALQTFQSTPVR